MALPTSEDCFVKKKGKWKRRSSQNIKGSCFESGTARRVASGWRATVQRVRRRSMFKFVSREKDWETQSFWED
jgi:hypothetical protein